ncbi:MAG: hypothetical protein FWH21_05845 [Kiritimatiellaeota bacterium]|nr:hypothetical protein [Kiritimatiellota bacterium]
MEAVAVTPMPEPAQSAIGNGRVAVPQPNRLWRYAVIPLGLLAILYFIRRESKN